MRLGRSMVANGSLANIYVVYDRLAEQCAGLIEAENDAVAVRYYRRGTADVPKSEWNDFSLIKLGTFDHKSMELIPFREREIIEVQWLDKEGD